MKSEPFNLSLAKGLHWLRPFDRLRTDRTEIKTSSCRHAVAIYSVAICARLCWVVEQNDADRRAGWGPAAWPTSSQCDSHRRRSAPQHPAQSHTPVSVCFCRVRQGTPSKMGKPFTRTRARPDPTCGESHFLRIITFERVKIHKHTIREIGQIKADGGAAGE